QFGFEQSWENLAIHPQHTSSLSNVFNSTPTDRSTALYVPLVFTSLLTNGAALAEALLQNESLASANPIADGLVLGVAEPSEASRSFRVALSNGDDGDQPGPTDYAGSEGAIDGIKSGLRSFEDLEDISIVAAPGSTFDYSDLGGQNHAQAVARRLISHCENMRYRIAVLDSVNGNILSEVRDYRSVFDSTRASLYYPWIRTFDPLTEQYIHVPPSGSICGIYARNDVERGVHKAPANEVVRMAAGLEFVMNKAEQEVLNPLGVNCLRFFEGRGYRIWGARTATSDPEWKYVNVRRYFAYLERSIEQGTQWAVFENNGPLLWDNVRRTVEDFLFNEWRQNHLLGSKPDQAFFVRCDRSTMTQNDLDNGRLVCLVGVAPLRPAEFVIFRIGQKTADA
ncbi:MAG TPA: phage tail sheath subtilisin-like domain-containing protein, partial [Gammaproteobacteria bacterium]